jgi:Ca2+-binding EF-hand superfamily protein
LEQAFKELDADNSGSLSYNELVTALKKLDLGLTPDQMQDLMTSMDENLDGKIDYLEFKHRFAHALNRGKASDEVKRHITRIQMKIAEKYGKGGKGIKLSFKAFDLDENKRISYTEFSSVLKNHFNGEEWTTTDQRRAIFNYLDDNRSGSISFSEFKHSFDQREDKRDDALQGAMMQKIFEAIRRARVQLRSAWRSLDKDNSKRIDAEEFRQGLDAMNALLDSPITAVQLDLLLKATPKDPQGFVKFEEFLDSFQVRKIDVDHHAKAPAVANTVVAH